MSAMRREAAEASGSKFVGRLLLKVWRRSNNVGLFVFGVGEGGATNWGKPTIVHLFFERRLNLELQAVTPRASYKVQARRNFIPPPRSSSC